MNPKNNDVDGAAENKETAAAEAATTPAPAAAKGPETRKPLNFGAEAAGPRATLKDLNAFRLTSDYVSTGGKKVLNAVPVRKPNRMTFVRTSEDGWFDTRVLELKEENETYLVDPGLWDDLNAELVAVTLVLCTTRQGAPFLWPIRLPDEMGKLNPWHASAREAAALATTTWVRIVANQQLGGYDVFAAARNDVAPVWPDESFERLVDIAFRGKVIDNINHPVLRRLRGEV